MQTGENSIIEACSILIIVTRVHSAFSCSSLKYKFITLWLNTTIKLYLKGSSINLTPFKSLINFSAFSQWGVGSRLSILFQFNLVLLKS